MSAYLPEIIGTVAGLCSTSSFVPQVIKAWRASDTEAISKRMYVITVTAFSLWIVYGVLIGSVPIVVFNSASLALSGTILFLKVRRRSALAKRPAPRQKDD
jgi:MtN3 and saliva related transmembrane protein